MSATTDDSLPGPVSRAPEIAQSPDDGVLYVRHKGLLVFGIMIATIMQVLDTTIANIAIPHMQSSLSATQDTVTWVLTSYIVASAIAMPITGWLADRVGSRRLFIWSVVGFMVASMLCGAARNLESMVAFRAAQGVFAAFLNPLSQAVMLDINPKEKHARAMSIWGTGVMIGPIMGPLLGGWLTESFNWRWIFFVNLPISILCLAILIWLLPSRPKRQRRFDFIGFGYLALALGAFQLMLDRGQTLDWFASGEILIEACVAAGAFWMFIVHLLTAKTPLFERALFSDRNMLTGTGFMLIMGVLILAVMALLPPLLQNLYGYSVFETGVLLMPRGVGIVLTMIIAGILTQRGVDARLLVGLGFVIAALSLYRMTGWSTVISREEIMIAGFIQGLGMGLIFIPLNLVAFATLAPHQRTEGSSLLQLSRSLGGSIGISLVSTNLVRQAQASHAEISSELTSAGTQGYEAVARSLGIEPEFALRLIEMEIRRQSTMVAYLDDFMLLAILTAVAVPLVMLLRKGDPAAAGNPPAALE